MFVCDSESENASSVLRPVTDKVECYAAKLLASDCGDEKQIKKPSQKESNSGRRNER